mmetsp:Transcript_3165/g.4822  ORF Transcript_3165/g.4822 Transcript_3165/m.4822 type:complete len:149 (-) Transcript_3165:7430-7876(-)
MFNSPRYLELDLGEIKLNSHLLKYDAEKDYRLVNREADLYDKYVFEFTGLGLHYWRKDATQKGLERVSLLKDLSVAFILKPCLEPLHPLHTSFIFEICVNDVSVNLRLTEIEELLGLLIIPLTKLSDYPSAVLNRKFQDLSEQVLDDP